MKLTASRRIPVLISLLLAACSQQTPPRLETLATTTIRQSVSTASDDARELGGGAMRLTGGLEFRAKEIVGLRFGNVPIPQGAKITAATISFKASAGNSEIARFQIRAEAADNSAIYGTVSKALSSRRRTTAAANWYPKPWSKGMTTRTSDLTHVVHEVVSRSGWKSSNALAFTIIGTGAAKRSAYARDAGTARAPLLTITYEPPQPPMPSPEPEPLPIPVPEPEPLPNDTLVTWHARLVATIENPRYGVNPDTQIGDNYWMDPVKQASSGDLYVYGRNFNTYMTSLIMAYRVTGDFKLVQQMDSLMEIVKSELTDTNGDGYLNWLYLTKTDASSDPFLGTDLHIMDEIMTHAMVAAVAHTFKQAGLNGSANFWTDYLNNDFEAKWRGRNKKASGFPFLTKNLMHPYVQWIRYHYYMGKLTGDGSYIREANRMVGVVKNNMRATSTPVGVGYVWPHRVELNGLVSTGCQPITYVKYTIQGLADLGSHSGLFDTTFMRRVANTMANTVWKDTGGQHPQLAANSCGSDVYMSSLYNSSSHPFTVLAPWDETGRLAEISIRAFYVTERGREDSPRIYNLPAMMVVALGQ